MKRFPFLIPVLTLLTSLVVAWIGTSVFILLNFESYVFYPQFSKSESYPSIYKQQLLPGEGQTTIDLLTAPNSQTDTIFLYLHGNGGRFVNLISDLSKSGTVYSPAYPGYSKSNSKPTLQGITQTVDITMDYLFKKGVRENQITVIGQSLGGYPALYLANKYPGIKQLVLINTFYSGYSMCQRSIGPFCLFVADKLNSSELAPHIRLKVIQFHDRNDKVVPFEEGEMLFKTLRTKDKQFYELEGDHNNFKTEDILKRLN